MNKLLEFSGRDGSIYKIDTSDPYSYQNEHFDVRRAQTKTDSGETEFVIVKTSLNPKKNPLLIREEIILKKLRKAGIKSGLGLEEYIPRVIDFHKLENGNGVLISSLSEFAPDLSTTQVASVVVESSRVDPRTSAWILTRFLRLAIFLNNEGVQQKCISLDNTLICPGILDKMGHKLLLLDWTQAQIFPEGLSIQKKREHLHMIGQCLIRMLGGNISTGKLPKHTDLGDTQYEDFLRSLALGDYYDPLKAYSDADILIKQLWGSRFHPFTLISK